MPLTLCQALTITTDNTSNTPTLPTKGNLIKLATNGKENTYMKFDEDPNHANCVSEGFMTRY
ncbi:MAG: hypothetical protein HUJ56_09715 [Erysipelotrichaceae bacterium]|nr:hypothetical protein [Erysipelotrichaceae bacterium]